MRNDAEDIRGTVNTKGSIVPRVGERVAGARPLVHKMRHLDLVPDGCCYYLHLRLEDAVCPFATVWGVVFFFQSRATVINVSLRKAYST